MANDPNSPTVVASVPTELEAGSLVMALDAHGIHAQTIGGFTAGFRAEAPGLVQVIVRQRDEQQAREVLTELSTKQEKIDWSQVDFGDPEAP